MDIFVAKRSFVTRVNGRELIVKAGHTHVTSDDPLYQAHRDKFRPINVVEQATARRGTERATAAPGEKRVTTRAPKR